MNSKIKTILLLLTLVFSVPNLLGATYRFTHHNGAVQVTRDLVLDRAQLAKNEKRFVKVYSVVVLVGAADYVYPRNCHDFAWGPYMTCMCTTSGTQKEAWWMNDQSQNWLDGSMQAVLTSQSSPSRSDYLFLTTDLQNLGAIYQNQFGDPIFLPVSDLNDVNGVEKSSHSAVLFSHEPSDVPNYSRGVYVSKWGRLGLYKHRWGKGYVPDLYLEKNTLKIFAPSWQGPYDIFHSQW